MEYKVVVGKDVVEIERNVNSAIKQGYTLCGNLFLDEENGFYNQPVIRDNCVDSKTDAPTIEDEYILLKDFEDPSGRVYAGVRKTRHQWVSRFALLQPSELDVKTDWFKKV